MIFFDSEVEVSSVVDFMTDSNLLIDDDVVVIVIMGGEVVSELVSVLVSYLRSVLVVIGRHS